MIGKYGYNPIQILYDELFKEFTSSNTLEEYNDLDDILKLILLNNGCKIDPDSKQHQIIKGIIPDEYEIRFVTGMIGNDVNEYYDFVIFNGKKILVIFKDYFQFVNVNDLDENDPMYDFKMSMGNSIYYDAIKKIVEVFYLTSEPMPGGLLTTSMATVQRWNQAIIAINIINSFKPVDDNDVLDIPINEVKEILNKDIKLQLYGIRMIV